MCVAVEKELVMAGFLNQQADKDVFTVDDIMEYVRMLWNAGCGPIRLNFSRQELADFLLNCSLVKNAEDFSYTINPDGLHITNEEIASHGNKGNAISYKIFDSLNAQRNVPYELLDQMGYRFLYRC